MVVNQYDKSPFHGGARGKVRRSPESLGFILWTLLLCQAI